MSATIFVAVRRSRCRRFGEIMESGCQCGAAEKSGSLGHYNFRLRSHGQLHDHFDNYNVLGDCDDACKILRRIMWSCGGSTNYSVTDVYVQVNLMYGP